ncbi:MJ1477/TM1410 family putative glycoside hydrolase [Brevifollis gellanilyticus]|uniref:Glycoside-hydrolase family GH114 TIM-barrel domain-containing protein n=1 Tax=Brevifollis gellanilyticus TaxID=748831 RepID=A0A512MG44_9BACT|nr:MJ1477/TM1410 family putative glycoside hydrolase [Brevifollis gellanilyticus]GEP45698.1 hypothetical protein BGE01nite_49890 [Brevifollis gellanilyticus]
MKFIIACCLLVFCFHAEAQVWSPKSFAYVLQADRLAANRAFVVQKLAASGRDLIVLDASYQTQPGGAWTSAELETIRRGKSGRRIVAYLSIGEAEDYRPYWQKSWDANKDGKPDAGAPAFLNIENPDWEGNYRVRYWQPAWQQIMLPYVDQIVAQGFDGIYLDIVDAFEFYEYDAAKKDWIDDRRNPETGATYRRDMIAWVGTIARRARAKRPGFLVIPQNASQLLDHADYRELISAIGVEDLFVAGKKLTTAAQSRYVMSFLQKLQPSGKRVLVIDYPKSKDIYPAAFSAAAKQGFTLLLTDRELTTLGESR